MPTVLSITRSNPIPVPATMDEEQTSSYREIIKQLAAQAPKPYGAIPPMPKKRKKKSRRIKPTVDPPSSDQQKPLQRMSHVEDWIVVDSKESLPDEQDLVSSPLRFLYNDIFTQVLPLHMPPPSLAATAYQEVPRDDVSTQTVPRPVAAHKVQTSDALEKDSQGIKRTSLHPEWKSDGEEEEEEAGEEEEEGGKIRGVVSGHRTLVRRHSISSFSKSTTPSTSTTASYVTLSSPPKHSNVHQVRWMQTIAQLRRSLVLSSSVSSPASSSSSPAPSTKSSKREGFIPMPPAPPRPASHRRRSEATTQPRFNPDTNTYTRDTRSNPDHLRMISAELNMMRARKLLSPLKPRGFLPRRKDPFVRGAMRRPSRLCQQL